MDLPDKSQSNAPKPKKDIQQVVEGVTLVPRPATRRMKDFLFSESPRVLGARIGRDIIVPRVKAGVEEAIGAFVSGMMWGDGARPNNNIVRGTVLRSGGNVYQAASMMPSPMGQAMAAGPTKSSGNYQDLVCPSQNVAEKLLANMYSLLQQYNAVAVADLYEAAGITASVSDNAYGWSSLEGARISKVRDGYLLELPRPSLIA